MDTTELKTRTKQFALSIIELVAKLPNTPAGRTMGNQLIRSGTAIGANYQAACWAKLTTDFIAKIDNVEEESDESCYWLELIGEAQLVPRDVVGPIWREANELTAIFTKTSITIKQKNPKR